MAVARTGLTNAEALARRAVRAAKLRRGRLQIDSPAAETEIAGEDLVVTGWAYAPQGIERVAVEINGRAARSARMGLPRPDVAEELCDTGAASAGWAAVVSVADLTAGQNVVRVSVHGRLLRGLDQELRFRWRPLADGEIPYDQVDLTGERYDPTMAGANSMAVEHHGRYRLIASLAAGRRALDAGCGYGYGAGIMAAAGALSVDGIDVSAQAIGRAQRDGDSRVTFTIGDVRSMPFADRAFDLVVCFEVLEHMSEHDQLFGELRRVLSPDGVLVISTPNRGQYAAVNPWHLRELTAAELETELRDRFAHVALVRQQLHLASVLGDAELLGLADSECETSVRMVKLSGGPPGSELYDVGIASDAPLPRLDPLIAVGDPRNELVDATIESWSERALRAEAEASMLRLRLGVARRFGALSDAPAPEPKPGSPKDVARALAAELAAPPFWMYPWELGSLGRVDPGVTLTHIHQTRLELIEPYVREALAAAGPSARVLDLACSEGWFSHRMLEWGAGSVVAIDVREQNVRRARLIRDHLGISPQRLAIQQADIFALPDLEPFDVVLMLGIVYHLENPVGAFRVARALTKDLLAAESQLTEQREPLLAGNGQAGVHYARAGSFAVWMERDQSENPVASHGGALSLIPNAEALLEMARAAGFVDCQLLDAAEHHEAQYRARERAVMVSRAR